ncbi:aminotransferase [Sulfitobacter mediterraneus]|uniref:aminotransferase n=1 Tax=Sulfitobacter mediterraneus TaxID=83219 RepID=UPI0019345C8E|nr:aminotransferase [Sulfitobacter mediterraneus]MBM1633466.1 aminotransferase [Sulfitobacter mediterraneus]MBM1642018.1 aminotransferase [Sulfitobacter mediterraneus]MBM1645331.1 aminotransferase [Sulfitobacter mediterraneus]MBM1648520.1 aminotransferase [Sulfitobacter mediterraneus]MBM1655170.1 aminotransferase [Sulfitobacter mediterraneus]
MHIDPFGVEIWMNEWEFKCELNLAETCVESLTIEQLLALSGKNTADLSELLGLKMTYGEIRGSSRLIHAICALYRKQQTENVIVTHGTIGANMLVHKAMISRGDRVVAVVPTYQQHYSIPASIGADVQQLKLREEDGWLPDLKALRRLVTPQTRLIAINNPNNPTGALMDRAMLEEIAQIARQADAWLLCDEVYRGTDQEGGGMTDAVADIYEKGISTAGMSKAFSLAGLRLGWIAGPSEVIEAVSIHRDYDTISVGKIDDHFAALALENSDRILARSKQITRDNLAILEAWVEGEPKIAWVRPKSATVTLLRYDVDMPSEAFCIQLLKETGVLLTPGAAFGMEGYLRIGFANPQADLRSGLAKISEFLARL